MNRQRAVHERAQIRRDIQGMRALAVAAVVAAHAGATWFEGGFVGVDLFFVLSGFLITSLLVTELVETGRISLGAFWGRRARRIVPASAVVLIAILMATYLFLPANELAAIATDGLWAALFVGNWRMAQLGTDYWAQERTVSPFQHYWSLGVEEQFYLAWPLIVAALGVVCAIGVRRRRSARSPARALRQQILIVALGVTVASFLYGLRLTTTDQPYAYFGTGSRVWQLGIGAALAAGLPWIARMRRAAAMAMAFAGAVGLGVAILVFDGAEASAHYPGWMALVPTLSAAALVASGAGATSTPVARLLSLPPLVWLGDRSYSLYLWHFPILVIGSTAIGSTSWSTRCALVAATVVVSDLSFRLIEKPIRRAAPLAGRQWLSLTLGAIMVATCVGAAAGVPKLALRSGGQIVLADGSRLDLSDQLRNPGAGYPTSPGGCIAVPRQAREPGRCDDFGAPGATRRVVLLGDSHAASISFGLSEAATQLGYGLTVWVKPGCKFVDVETEAADAPYADTCADYKAEAVRRLLTDPPDLVVLLSATNQQQPVRVGGRLIDAGPQARQAYEAGLERFVTTLTDRGIPVTLLGDGPATPGNEIAASCLQRTHSEQACSFRRLDAWRPEVLVASRLRSSGLVRLVDLAPYWCGPQKCSPIAEGTLVYRNLDHISVAFSRVLADRLADDVLRPGMSLSSRSTPRSATNPHPAAQPDR